MSAPILVAGATGRVGRHVVRELAGADRAVRAMTRDPETAGWNDGNGVEVVEGDLLEPDSLDRALAGVDRAFLLSPNVREMREMQENFVAAAERAGVSHVVKLSAAGADPDSSWSIARWHGQVERRIESSSLGYTFVRPVHYMQNLLDDAETIRSEGYFARATPPDARVNAVDTRDVARVAATALLEAGHEGATYKPAGPEPITFPEMAEAIAAATGREVAFRELSPEEARASYLADGAPEWLAEAMVGLEVAFGKGIADLTTDDVVRVTGEPPRGFRTFAEDYADAFVPEPGASGADP